MKLKKQKDLIQRKCWDCLIVLDACRYDFFEKVFDLYMDGTLLKVISSGSHTTEWFKKTFQTGNWKDTVYVSSNPYIASTKIDWSDINPETHEIAREFNANDYFYKVVNVDSAPQKVAKATKMARAKYPSKRIISHFMQPHDPYLCFDEKGNSFKKIIGRLKNTVKHIGLSDAKVVEIAYKMKKLWSRSSRSSKSKNNLERIAEEYGNKTLRALYLKNLCIVLDEVSNLTRRLPGDIVVTADHGEFLGEQNQYWHTAFSDSLILKQVPWLKIHKKG